MTEPDKDKPRVVDAEVVRKGDEDRRDISTDAPHEFRGRYSRSYVFLQSGGRPLDQSRLRRMRGRLGMAALMGLGVSAGLIYMAATTEYVLLAAIWLLLGILVGSIGLLLVWVWRVVGKVLAGNFPEIQ